MIPRTNPTVMKECMHHGMSDHAVRSSGRIQCRQCAIDKVNTFRRNLKQKALGYKGGCCQICGYNKCVWSLTFHHLDPSKKEFAPGAKNVKSWEAVKKELDKCVLLCHNCHGEVHAGVTSIDDAELEYPIPFG
jgi:hypothetical protein